MERDIQLNMDKVCSLISAVHVAINSTSSSSSSTEAAAATALPNSWNTRGNTSVNSVTNYVAVVHDKNGYCYCSVHNITWIIIIII